MSAIQVKQRINRVIKAHLFRGAFCLILLVAICMIPFALGQRATTKESAVAAPLLLGLGPVSTLSPGDASASGSWTVTGSLNTARYLQTATLLPNGMVLVAGGLDSSLNALDSAELYDPASETWTATGSLKSARDIHALELCPDYHANYYIAFVISPDGHNIEMFATNRRPDPSIEGTATAGFAV